MKRILLKAVKFLGPILFLFFLFRIVDPWKTLQLLKNIEPQQAVISLLFFPVLMAGRTLRWWLIYLPLDPEVSFRKLYQINYLSWFLGAVPLAGVAAVAKLLYLKEEGHSASRVLISFTLDKLFDILGLILFGVFAFLYFPRGLLSATHLWILYGACLLCLSVGVLMRSRLARMGWGLLNRYLSKRFQPFKERLAADFQALWPRMTTALVFAVIGISIGICMLRALVLFLVAGALSIHAPFLFIVGCRALIGLTNIIPISMSGLGTRDAALLLTFSLVGLPREAALALGFAMFLWTILFKASGIFFLLKRPLPLHSSRTMWENIFPRRK